MLFLLSVLQSVLFSVFWAYLCRAGFFVSWQDAFHGYSIPAYIITVTSEEICSQKSKLLSEYQKASHFCNYLPGVGGPQLP